jgi:hypothetical protein
VFSLLPNADDLNLWAQSLAGESELGRLVQKLIVLTASPTGAQCGRTIRATRPAGGRLGHLRVVTAGDTGLSSVSRSKPFHWGHGSSRNAEVKAQATFGWRTRGPQLPPGAEAVS